MSENEKAVAIGSEGGAVGIDPTTVAFLSDQGTLVADRRRRYDVVLDCIIALLAVTPLLLTRHLPLLDVPNHIARQYILRDLDSSPILQTFYTVRWALVPNLALELFVVGARNFLSIDMAVRAFCIVAVLLQFFGMRYVNLALGGERSRVYRVTPLLSYGGPFQFGFLSFSFGIGLALVFFGLYLRLREKSLARLIAVFIPCSFMLLLCHLAAFGCLGVAMASFEIRRALEAEGMTSRLLPALLARAGRVAAITVPSFLFFALLGPAAETGNNVHYPTLYQRLESIAALTMFSSPYTELPLLAVALIGLVVAVSCKAVRIDRTGWVMAAVFTAAWLALPRFAFTYGFVEYRIPWAASFFLLSTIVPAAQYERHFALTGALAGALVLARIGLIAWFWLSWEPALSAIDNALSTLPLGSRLFVVKGDPPSLSAGRRPPYDHVGAYAVARRQAYFSNIFVDIPGQILHLKPTYKREWSMFPPDELDRLPSYYNYVLVLRPKWTKVSKALRLRYVTGGSDFILFKRDP